jgi:VWFA-related protein
MRTLQSSVLSLFLLVPLAASPLRAQPSAAAPEAPSSPPSPVTLGADPVLWPEAQRSFLQDGPGLLLTAEQRAELRSLDEGGRERFIEAFYKKTPGLREGIAQRRRLADSLFTSATDVRWQIAFLNGAPADRMIVDCGTAFKPVEVWTYHRGVDARSGKPVEHGVVIYRPGPGEPFRLWLPLDSKRSLYTSEMEYWLEQWEELRGQISGQRFDLQVCEEAVKKIDKATGVPGLTGAHSSGIGYTIRPIDNASYLATPKDLAAWSHQATATAAPPAPTPLEVTSFEMRFPELQGQRMRVRALLQVSTKGLQTVDDNGKPAYALSLQGVVEQDGKPFEELRVRYHLPVPTGGDPLVLAVDRSLRLEKSFLLRLDVKDETSGAEARVARGFTVPSVATPDPVALNVPGGDLVPVMVKKGKDSLILMPPPADVVLGLWRAEALVSGDLIKRVVFLVDGTAQLTRTAAPFTAELRLARFPTEQTVRAEGFDDKGKLVAADEVILNQPRGALGVWIVDPPKGRRITSGKLLARAELMVPDGRRVDSLEFKVNDKPVAKLAKPPWQAEVEIPAAEDLAYITVSVSLDDGTKAEAVRFVKSPNYVEEVDVNLVELYVAVADKSNQPVLGLTQADFEAYESGKKQEIAKFEQVQNLPLTVGVLLDTSGSMESSLGIAERAAADFLHRVMKPKDKAFAVSFAGRPRLDMPPTDDIEAVARSISGLQAVGDTALHDALIQSLYYFRGMQGQRALVLLSDGDDNASYFKYKDALEYAKRSGVAIYTIGFNLSILGGGVKGKLTELSETTGGRLFTTDKAQDLPAIYAQIEKELRSRYLVAYNSDQKGPQGAQAGYREVEVKVKKPGLKARTVRGTYQ